jgi:hypothetical protein
MSDTSKTASFHPAQVKTLPIVGAFWRPPAKTILENLALDTKLHLIPEPENQYDINAVAVYVHHKDIPIASLKALESQLPGCGHSLESLEDLVIIHLGYIPKELAKILRERGFNGAEGTFQTGAKGGPYVEFVDPTKKVE